MLHRRKTQIQTFTSWRCEHVYKKRLGDAELSYAASRHQLRQRHVLNAWKCVQRYYTRLSQACQTVTSQRTHALQRKPLQAWNSVCRYYASLAEAYGTVVSQRTEVLIKEPLLSWNCVSAWKKRKKLSAAVITNQYHYTLQQDAYDSWCEMYANMIERRETAVDRFWQKKAEFVVEYFAAFKDAMRYLCRLRSAHRCVRTQRVHKKEAFVLAEWRARYFLRRCGLVFVMYVCM
jgi:hypothetical protein